MRHVIQRGKDDCGVACLAMVAGVTYARARAVLQDRLTPRGLDNKDLVRGAKRLGVLLRASRRQALPYEVPAGILCLLWNERRTTEGHFVAVNHGMVLCPSGEKIKPIDAYLKKNKGRIGSLLWRVS